MEQHSKIEMLELERKLLLAGKIIPKSGTVMDRIQEIENEIIKIFPFKTHNVPHRQ